MKIMLNQTLIDLTPNGSGFNATLDGQTVFVEILNQVENRLNLIIRYSDDKSVVTSAVVSSSGDERWVTVNGQTFVLKQQSTKSTRGGSAMQSSGELIAPMPGAIRGVFAAKGDSVSKGQTLIIMEAMKMEIKIAAPNDGLIIKLWVQQGQTVEKDQPLIEIQ